MKYRNSETRESGEGKNRERGKERKKKKQRTRMERGEKSEHETFPSRTWKLDVTGLNSVSRPRVMKRNCIKLRCLSLTRSTTRSLWRTFFFRASRCWLFRETFSIIPCVAGCVRAFFFFLLPVVSEQGDELKFTRLCDQARKTRPGEKIRRTFRLTSARVFFRCRLEIYAKARGLIVFAQIGLELTSRQRSVLLKDFAILFDQLVLRDRTNEFF